MASGFFLALEGIDGSGTTTQAAHLSRVLRARGRAVHRTAEPSSGPVGTLIRTALVDTHSVADEPLALLFAADRLDHLEREIEPALARGDVVVSDRYLLSSLAYQGSYLPLDWVRTINQRARRPDASILLRVPPQVAAARRRSRGGTDERFDDIDRQARIAVTYEQVLELPDVGPTFAIDADRPLAEVSQALEELVQRLLR